MRFQTRAIHAGEQVDKATGAICKPVYMTSTFVQEDIGETKGWDYSRAGNPTRDSLEANLASLENAQFGHVFSSGMAALQALMYLLKAGDHMLCSAGVYGGTWRFLTEMMVPWGLQVDFVDTSDVEAVKAAWRAETKMLLIETPTNPMMHMSDIAALAGLAHEGGAQLVVDNTFLSPRFQQPIELGADIVLHSCTKYLGGHSDMIMGALLTSEKGIHEKMTFAQKAAGAVPGPFDCFMMLRSVKTLGVRMERHATNAMEIARWLEKHPQVGTVYYPGLESHPQHDLAKRQLKGFGGMLSFELEDYETARRVARSFKVISLAESLGGVESLVCHPVGMTHASVPEEERLSYGLTDRLLRLSVGIEDVDDLLADLEQAFKEGTI